MYNFCSTPQFFTTLFDLYNKITIFNFILEMQEGDGRNDEDKHIIQLFYWMAFVHGLKPYFLFFVFLMKVFSFVFVYFYFLLYDITDLKLYAVHLIHLLCVLCAVYTMCSVCVIQMRFYCIFLFLFFSFCVISIL